MMMMMIVINFNFWDIFLLGCPYVVYKGGGGAQAQTAPSFLLSAIKPS